jgi:hypothetical protein
MRTRDTVVRDGRAGCSRKWANAIAHKIRVAADRAIDQCHSNLRNAVRQFQHWRETNQRQ